MSEIVSIRSVVSVALVALCLSGLSSLFGRRKSSLRRGLRLSDFRSSVAISTKHLIGLFLWPRGSAKVWIDILPDHSAFGGNLEEPAEPALIDERVAVRQTLSVRYSRAEEIRHWRFLVFPYDLFGRRIDFEHARERERLVQAVWPIVEKQDVAVG